MYRPIFSKDLKEYENKKVSVLGKVVNIEEEKKLIRLKLLDPFGYIDVVLFEYYEVKPFDTVIVLGNVSKDNNENYYILGKYLVKIKGDEIFWRKRFLTIYGKVRKKKKKRIKRLEEEKEIIKENFNPDDDLDQYKKLRKEILEFIRDNDKGDGVSLNEILEFFENEKLVDQIIKDLLSSGEIYESSSGKYKII
ncbi:MAG: hypothetical protein ACP5G1_00775 [Nanopusillaceae archaeon]